MQDHTTFEHLLMKAVDEHLSLDERREFQRHLETCTRCQEEYRDFRETKQRTDGLSRRILQDAAGNPARETRRARNLVNLSTFAILGSLLFLTTFAAYHFFLDSQIHIGIKLAAALLTAAFLSLGLYALTQRIRASKTDPYLEIDQ